MLSILFLRWFTVSGFVKSFSRTPLSNITFLDNINVDEVSAILPWIQASQLLLTPFRFCTVAGPLASGHQIDLIGNMPFEMDCWFNIDMELIQRFLELKSPVTEAISASPRHLKFFLGPSCEFDIFLTCTSENMQWKSKCKLFFKLLLNSGKQVSCGAIWDCKI